MKKPPKPKSSLASPTGKPKSSLASPTGKPKADYSIHWRSPWDLETPLLNDCIYGKAANDPNMDALVESVRKRGILTPLIVTTKNVVISGNRRTVAACRAGLDKVPCFVRDIAEEDHEFAEILIEANENRVKEYGSTVIENAVKSLADNPLMWIAAQRLDVARLQRRAVGDVVEVDAGNKRVRKQITRARAFADAVIDIVRSYSARGIRPTVRQVHYALLNDPPITDTQSGRRYANNEASYNALTSLAARLRVAGELPFNAFTDATRPLRNPRTYRDAAEYVSETLRLFGGDYRRNYMKSQDVYFAVAVEKEAEAAILETHILERWPGVPLVVCRGFSSFPLVNELVMAYKASGKKHLTIITLSDCDPQGEDIAADLSQKLIEIGLDPCAFTLVRAGLTHEQARRFNARPQPIKAKGKAGKTVARRFADRHGTSDVYELEAIPPHALLSILDEAIESRIDAAAYNQEVEADERDAKYIMDERKRLLKARKA